MGRTETGLCCLLRVSQKVIFNAAQEANRIPKLLTEKNLFT